MLGKIPLGGSPFLDFIHFSKKMVENSCVVKYSKGFIFLGFIAFL